MVKKGNKLIRPMKKEIYSLSPNEETVLFYRLHPVQAAANILKIELNWYQRKNLVNLWFKPFNLMCWGRGASKSFSIALFSVLWAMLFPYQKVIALGPSKRQGDYIFNEIEDLYAKSDFFRASVKRRILRSPMENKVELTNFSTIRSLPIGPGGEKIRGARAHVLALDEYAQFDKDIIDLVIRPFLAIKKKGIDNKLIISSTAYYKWNHFWTQFQRYKKLSILSPTKYSCTEYNYNDIVIDKDSPFEVAMEQVNEARESMTESDFRMEWLGIFPDGIDNFFSTYLIDTCTPKPPKNKEVEIEKFSSLGKYLIAIDCAREEGGANFALGIGKITDESLNVVKMITLNGASYQEQIKTIRQSVLDFPVISIFVDKGGGGTTIKDLLAETWYSNNGKVVSSDSTSKIIHLPILDMDDPACNNKNGLKFLRLIDFHGSKHSSLFINLKAEMEHGRVKFPLDLRRDKDKEIELLGQNIVALKKELAVIEATPKGAYLNFSVPKRFRMDRAATLAMLVDGWISLTRKAEEIHTEKIELATGFFI